MISKSNRFVICYNGEIYNTDELLKNYSSSKLIIKGHSDTEIILELFEKYGLDIIIPKLIGMFAFALFDRKNKRSFYVGTGLESSLFIGEYLKMN